MSPAIIKSSTANVPASASSTLLWPSVGTVSGRTVFNDSTATLYLNFGGAASTTAFVVEIAPGAYYEFPAPPFPGEVYGIWSAANGAARLMWSWVA